MSDYSLSENVVWMEELKPMRRKDLRRLPATEICKFIYKKVLNCALDGAEEMLIEIPGERYLPWMPIVKRDIQVFFPDSHFEWSVVQNNIEIYINWSEPKQEEAVAVTIGGFDSD
jgi:hypothetical protein